VKQPQEIKMKMNDISGTVETKEPAVSNPVEAVVSRMLQKNKVEYYDLNNLLKAYQVGEHDVVAAFDEDEAIEVLVAYTGCCHSNDFDKNKDVTDLTDKLDVMLKCEDGNDLETLGTWLGRLSEPEYLFGWE
tara:strand:- start:87 stop:482 length:396 start_codon:yes stop_codon:yes gene_type:complete